MKRQLLIISTLMIGVASLRAELAQGEAGCIADAIWQVEGGSRAKSPYGILSVHVANEAEARRVCLNTIINNHRRWEAAGQPGVFIEFLGNVYCPPSADPIGNRNWKRNVKALLKKG